MKCENCGKVIDSVLLNMFNHEGIDSDVRYQLNEFGESATCIDTNQNWTGYEQSEDEMAGTICCPHCKKFPFISREIQVYDIVRIVCFRKGPEE